MSLGGAAGAAVCGAGSVEPVDAFGAAAGGSPAGVEGAADDVGFGLAGVVAAGVVGGGGAASVGGA